VALGTYSGGKKRNTTPTYSSGRRSENKHPRLNIDGPEAHEANRTMPEHKNWPVRMENS
jgi:hypothetical protein